MPKSLTILSLMAVLVGILTQLNQGLVCCLEKHQDALADTLLPDYEASGTYPLPPKTQSDAQAKNNPNKYTYDCPSTCNKTKSIPEATKPIITEHKVEKLPGNLTKDIVVIEKTKNLSDNQTVNITTERQVVKDRLGKETDNQTITETVTKVKMTPDNEKVTKTVKKKMVVDEEGEEESEEEKEETIIEKVIKPDNETCNENTNDTVKETKVERKIIRESDKMGETPKQDLIIEKVSRIDTNKSEVTCGGKADAAKLDEENGPKKITVVEKKVEQFPNNQSKEITVKEKVEKLPSNETVKKSVVAVKEIKDTTKNSEVEQKETIIQKEVKQEIGNKITDSENVEKSECERNVESLKKEIMEMKEKLEREKEKQPLNETQTMKTVEAVHEAKRKKMPKPKLRKGKSVRGRKAKKTHPSVKKAKGRKKPSQPSAKKTPLTENVQMASSSDAVQQKSLTNAKNHQESRKIVMPVIP